MVKFISDLTGKNFILDERVKGKISVYSPSKLSTEEAYNVFTSVLELKGFTVMQSGKVAYTVKPHPNFLVKSQDYPLINFSVINDPLENALRDCDIVYSSNMTSAALEAYLVGLPVVVMLNEMELNFSPLRGLGGVRFVSTPGELADVLQSADTRFVTSAGYNDFFFLDAELPRWQRLLPSAETA